MSEQNTALVHYNQSGVVVTREIATKIVETLWKGASPVEKAKAITICSMYNLNPVMNHLYMLPFKGKEGTTYTIAIGIEATRLLAHRKHTFTYLDLSPRRATKEELIKILGEDLIDKDAIYFITLIKDLKTGAEDHGLGWWKGSVYGAEKGNSVANMASIRSERQALKRLYPAEMPTGVEVMDERFVEAASNGSIEGDYRVMDETTGEITEQAATPEAGPEPEPANRDIVSEPQRRKLFAAANNAGIPMDDLKGIIKSRFNKEHSKDLTKTEASELIDKIEAGFILNMDTGEWTK